MFSIQMNTVKIAGKEWNWSKEWYKPIYYEPIKMTKLELLLTSVTISYIITYLIVK